MASGTIDLIKRAITNASLNLQSSRLTGQDMEIVANELRNNKVRENLLSIYQFRLYIDEAADR